MSGSGAGGGRGTTCREQIASACAVTGRAGRGAGGFGGPLDPLGSQGDPGQFGEQAAALANGTAAAARAVICRRPGDRACPHAEFGVPRREAVPARRAVIPRPAHRYRPEHRVDGLGPVGERRPPDARPRSRRADPAYPGIGSQRCLQQPRHPSASAVRIACSSAPGPGRRSQRRGPPPPARAFYLGGGLRRGGVAEPPPSPSRRRGRHWQRWAQLGRAAQIASLTRRHLLHQPQEPLDTQPPPRRAFSSSGPGFRCVFTVFPADPAGSGSTAARGRGCPGRAHAAVRLPAACATPRSAPPRPKSPAWDSTPNSSRAVPHPATPGPARKAGPPCQRLQI